MSNREPISVEQVTTGLRALADEYDAGYRSVPEPGQGGQRVAGVPIVPVVIHDALCGWRIMSEQEDSEPRVLACAGCGLGVLLTDAQVNRRP